MKALTSVLLLAMLAPACSKSERTDVRAADKTAKANEKRADDHEADNTGRNVRDQSGTTVTPMDQSPAKGDVELTQRVRQALMEDSTFSINAQNIKIVSKDGVVTLRGPVQDQAELDNVVAKARAVAGVQSVDNQLEIKGG